MRQYKQLIFFSVTNILTVRQQKILPHPSSEKLSHFDHGLNKLAGNIFWNSVILWALFYKSKHVPS